MPSYANFVTFVLLNIVLCHGFRPTSQQLYIAYVSAIHYQQALSSRIILVWFIARSRFVFLGNQLE